MIQAIQLILAILFIVFIHELGHYMFARLFNVRVEKFYMLFNIKTTTNGMSSSSPRTMTKNGTSIPNRRSGDWAGCL